MNVLEARRRMLGAGVYKKTVIGNPAIAQGSLSRRYPGITMQGWTGQAQYEGNQLFDKSEIVLTSQLQYIPVNVGDGEFTLSTQYNSIYPKDVFFLTGNVISVASSDTNGVDKNNPRTISSENGYVTVALRLKSEGDMSPLDYDIMLNAGSTALPYEPYTGGAPSPSPDYPQEIVSAGNWNEETQKYEYQVKLTGANLFDAEYFRTTLDWKPTADGNGYPYIPIYVGKGNTVTISTDGTPDEGLGFYCAVARTNKDTSGNVYTWLYHSTNANLIKTNVSFGVIEDDYIYFALNSGHNNIENFLNAFTNFQIEISAQRTEYQPYKEQTVTLTADRPLTKWDRLEKRNGQWGWVYKSGTISGNDINIIQKYNDEIIEGMLRHSFGTSFSPGYEHIDNIFCNKLVDSRQYDNFDFAYSVLGSGILRIISNDNTGIDTLEEMQTYWASLPDVVFYYETTEETFASLSASEQEQMNSLHTFRPTTVLSNDAGCEMSLTYKTKKSLEVTT